MKVITKTNRLQKITQIALLNKNTIGFIPTMGALHEGHLTLIQQAQKENNIVIVSIFVNPKQFNSIKDFNRYPQPIEQDKALIRDYADYLFYPSVEGMYPDGFQSSVHVGKLAETLEGEHRPGHFDGMATVVLKLLHMCVPTRTYFGLKDYQQYLIVKQMVKDLNLPIKIVGVPTIREESKLALSSRNQLLSLHDKTSAAQIFSALQNGKELIMGGERDVRTIEKTIKTKLEPISKKIDYVAVRSLSLEAITSVNQDVVILVALYVGDIRLIDNIIVRF
ncbi:MAG: pantoate--beta-alanine ligase [bacterium]|nr:pantoate--beta-alanine ligase [bacterium]